MGENGIVEQKQFGLPLQLHLQVESEKLIK